MIVAYELAQLSTTARNLPRAGAALLVLGSGNVDEVRLLRSPFIHITSVHFLDDLVQSRCVDI
jgi:hypothetical protein